MLRGNIASSPYLFLTCLLVTFSNNSSAEAASRGSGTEMFNGRISYTLPMKGIDGPDFAYQLTRSFMSKEAWTQSVNEMREISPYITPDLKNPCFFWEE